MLPSVRLPACSSSSALVVKTSASLYVRCRLSTTTATVVYGIRRCHAGLPLPLSVPFSRTHSSGFRSPFPHAVLLYDRSSLGNRFSFTLTKERICRFNLQQGKPNCDVQTVRIHFARPSCSCMFRRRSHRTYIHIQPPFRIFPTQLVSDFLKHSCYAFHANNYRPNCTVCVYRPTVISVCNVLYRHVGLFPTISGRQLDLSENKRRNHAQTLLH